MVEETSIAAGDGVGGLGLCRFISRELVDCG